MTHGIHSWEAENKELKLMLDSRISLLPCHLMQIWGPSPSILDEFDVNPLHNFIVKSSVLEIHSNAPGLLFFLITFRFISSFSDSCVSILYLKFIHFPLYINVNQNPRQRQLLLGIINVFLCNSVTWVRDTGILKTIDTTLHANRT